jgi:hypothetical protein
LVEEAIRNGTWIPPSTSRDGSVNPGAKPNMFEAFVSGEKGPLEHRKPNESAYGHGKEDVDWDAIMVCCLTSILER